VASGKERKGQIVGGVRGNHVAEGGGVGGVFYERGGKNKQNAQALEGGEQEERRLSKP